MIYQYFKSGLGFDLYDIVGSTESVPNGILCYDHYLKKLASSARYQSLNGCVETFLIGTVDNWRHVSETTLFEIIE